MPMALPIHFAGVELYFDDLSAGRRFYADVLGLLVQEDQPDHHVQLSIDDRFLCLEAKGLETYPSADKAVLFFRVPDLEAALAPIPQNSVAQIERNDSPPWAAIRDPEGHTVLLLEAPKGQTGERKPAA